MKETPKMDLGHVEVFTKATILNAIDTGMLKYKWEDLDIEFEQKSGAAFSVKVSYKNKEISKEDLRIDFNKFSYTDQLKGMMGVAIIVLNNLREEQKKPILHVVKGGLS